MAANSDWCDGKLVFGPPRTIEELAELKWMHGDSKGQSVFTAQQIAIIRDFEELAKRRWQAEARLEQHIRDHGCQKLLCLKKRDLEFELAEAKHD